MSDNIINVNIIDEPLQIIGEIITSGTVIEANISTGPTQIEAIIDSGVKGEPFKFEDFTSEQLASLKGEPFRFEDLTPEQLQIVGADKHYRHKQIISSDTWIINHNLNKRPSINISDSAGTTLIGDTEYVDDNVVIEHFTNQYSGEAYLN